MSLSYNRNPALKPVLREEKVAKNSESVRLDLLSITDKFMVT
ncbi:hypothetical protein D1BOALGB6SA_9514 [Olavius sp. associated proteobacterium Delta 1]|nr:hypothetical protein D1BOALGB6SA_9514 [Olavius sp. associated proteobacterium Delta 1]